MADRATEVGGRWPGAGGAATSTDVVSLEEELRSVRERLAFYESFDQLIQENVARSGELLRQAAEQREAAMREVDRARAEADRRLADQRTMLTLIGDELIGLQGQIAALARRVAAALGESSPPEPAPAPSFAEEPESDRMEDVAVPFADAAVGAGDTVSGEQAAEPAAESATATAPTPETDRARMGSVPEPAMPTAGAPVPSRAVSVVVHGVPRAADALALQRHLAGLGHVEAVEAREYVAGVLRLHVFAQEPLTPDDLRGWHGGEGLEPVHVLPDVIEVKLPGAAGL